MVTRAYTVYYFNNNSIIIYTRFNFLYFKMYKPCTFAIYKLLNMKLQL